MPVDSGNRARLFALLKDLRVRGHKVHFLYLDRLQQADLSKMARLYEELEVIQYKKGSVASEIVAQLMRHLGKSPKLMGTIDRIASRLNIFGKRHPYGIDDWYDKRIDYKVLDCKKRHRFDAVLVEYVYLSKALDCFESDVLKIIDTHDVMADRHEIYTRQGLNPVGFFTTKEEEKKGLERADIVLAIQEEDRAYFESITEKKVITIGYKMHRRPLTASPHSSSGGLAKYALFVGSNNVANQHAVDYLLEEVWPAILKEIPTAMLRIVGSICYYVENKKRLENVVMNHYVKDLTPLFMEDCIVLNPIWIGTGLKIKNIEALYMARPLVTTPVGAQGLKRWMNRAFWVVQSKNEMINVVVSLYADPEMRIELSQRAFAFVKEYEQQYEKGLDEFLVHLTQVS